ncbi:MAG: LCP family protein, partial [Pseudonocardiaceae bacterium]
MPPQNPRRRPGPPPGWTRPPLAGGAGAAPGRPGPPPAGSHPAAQLRPPSEQSRPGRRPPAGPPPGRYAGRRRRRPLRTLRLILVVLLLLVIGLAVYVDRSLNRVEALSDYSERVANTPGTNWLIVGSDSRAGLTPEETLALATGDEAGASGQRTDTIMLLHIPGLASGGSPTLVSLPRDSSVPIPGQGRLKLNAAYSIGGAPLL